MLLKKEIGLESWAMDAFVGAVLKRRGGASLGMDRGFNSAGNELQFFLRKRHDFRHDRAAIGPRSGHDRAAIGP